MWQNELPTLYCGFDSAKLWGDCDQWRARLLFYVNLPSGKRDIGFVFQDYALFPALTVEARYCFWCL